MKGAIAFFSPQLWGFITPLDKSQPDIFFHHSSIQGINQRDLVSGLLVEYDTGIRNDKPIALNIRLVKGDAQ